MKRKTNKGKKRKKKRKELKIRKETINEGNK